MNRWDELEPNARGTHWKTWGTRPKRTMRVNNYMSAVVFAFAAGTLVMHYGI